MRPVSNACSDGPGEVPDNEVDAHPGNPGSDVFVTDTISIAGEGWSRLHVASAASLLARGDPVPRRGWVAQRPILRRSPVGLAGT